MKKLHITNLDAKILQRKHNIKRPSKIDIGKITISGIIDYFIKENNPDIGEFDNFYEESIAELGYIETNKRVGIIIPKPGTIIRYGSSMIGPSTILTFNKTKGNNLNPKICENRLGYELREIIDNTIKGGKFIKLKDMPEEFRKYTP